jgi:hypothetical protein
MDTQRQGRYIVILRASDDAAMRAAPLDHSLVQAHEMTAIKSQNGPALRGGKGQHQWIRNFLVSLAGLVGSQNVVAETTQSIDHATIETLIGVEKSHS